MKLNPKKLLGLWYCNYNDYYSYYYCSCGHQEGQHQLVQLQSMGICETRKHQMGEKSTSSSRYVLLFKQFGLQSLVLEHFRHLYL